jgi:hypothetical protein
MADWVTISSLATAGGTLVLAVATFAFHLLYGDGEGGQRVISRFVVIPAGDDDWLVTVSRHWNLDRDDPR